MTTRMGERLIEDDLITDRQLELALERQRIHGGRLGDNLAALGVISKEDALSVFTRIPPAPRTVEDTKLSPSLIADLIMKHVVSMGEFTLPEAADAVKLPASVVDTAVDLLRRDRLLEVRSGGELSKLSYKLAVTDQGRNRAAELRDRCHYVGPAPVVIEEYRSMVETQTVNSILVSEDTIKGAFSDLIVREELLESLGPAVSSGRAIFLYGPPGNGKTAMAEALGKVLPGAIYLPYAILVGGEVIVVYDTLNHVAAEPANDPGAVDQRWVLVRRPIVTVGGELTLTSLDLHFDPVTKFYEAPLQMRANNGLFIVDDFGRQQVDPRKLLNRWIVPLERRTDFLTLHTGMKFEIPFDELVVFSTNIEPKNLVDEAFLRRIRYKIKIDHPDLEEFEEIFKAVCESNSIDFNKDVFDSLINDYYLGRGVTLNRCHPRDIIDHIIDSGHYHGYSPELTEKSIASAWESYLLEL